MPLTLYVTDRRDNLLGAKAGLSGIGSNALVKQLGGRLGNGLSCSTCHRRLPRPMPVHGTPTFLCKGSRFCCSFFVHVLFSYLISTSFLSARQFMGSNGIRHNKFTAVRRLRSLFFTCCTAFKGPAAPVGRGQRRVCRRYLSTTRGRPNVFDLAIPANNNGALSSLTFTLGRTVGCGGRQVVCVVPCASVVRRATSVFHGVLKSNGIVRRRVGISCSGSCSGGCSSSGGRSSNLGHGGLTARG